MGKFSLISYLVVLKYEESLNKDEEKVNDVDHRKDGAFASCCWFCLEVSGYVEAIESHATQTKGWKEQ